jgi:hypothetical protein
LDRRYIPLKVDQEGRLARLAPESAWMCARFPPRRRSDALARKSAEEVE